MSTIKSSAENLTLNADGSNNDIIFQSNGSNIATLDQAGNLTATTFTGAVTGAASLNLLKTGGALTGGVTSTSDITVGDAYISSGYSQFNNLRVPNNGYIGNPTNVSQIQLQGSGQTLFGGDVSLGNGDIIFGTAGKGICLGVTTNTDANTLDDYEEGTWTPGLSTSANTSGTWSSAVGRYTKVGNMVTLYMGITGTAMYFTSSAGYLAITGMPFTADMFTGMSTFSGSWGANYVASSIGGTVYVNSTSMYLFNANSGWSTSGVSGIGMCITYRTNS